MSSSGDDSSFKSALRDRIYLILTDGKVYSVDHKTAHDIINMLFRLIGISSVKSVDMIQRLCSSISDQDITTLETMLNNSSTTRLIHSLILNFMDLHSEKNFVDSDNSSIHVMSVDLNDHMVICHNFICRVEVSAYKRKNRDRYQRWYEIRFTIENLCFGSIDVLNPHRQIVSTFTLSQDDDGNTVVHAKGAYGFVCKATDQFGKTVAIKFGFELDMEKDLMFLRQCHSNNWHM